MVVFPVILLALLAIPLLVIAFVVTKRTRDARLAAAPHDAAAEAELEREFAAAERYEETWREEQHRSGPQG